MVLQQEQPNTATEYSWSGRFLPSQPSYGRLVSYLRKEWPFAVSLSVEECLELISTLLESPNESTTATVESSYYRSRSLLTAVACALQQGALSRTESRHSSYTPLADYLQPKLSRLDGLASLQRDWDSYGAEPIAARAIGVARRLIQTVAELFSQLAGEDAAPYAVAPLVDGGVQVEWRGRAGAIEVEISPDGTLGYLYVKGHEIDSPHEEQDDVSFPDVLELVAKVIIP